MSDLPPKVTAAMDADGVLTLGATRAATTPQLLKLINAAEDEGFDNVIPNNIVRRLDPTGTHVVCMRWDEAELAQTAEESKRFDGRKTWRTEIPLGQVIPCEVLMKLRGRSASYHGLLDAMVYDLLDLEMIDRPDFNAHDAETQHG